MATPEKEQVRVKPNPDPMELVTKVSVSKDKNTLAPLNAAPAFPNSTVGRIRSYELDHNEIVTHQQAVDESDDKLKVLQQDGCPKERPHR